MTRRGRCKRNLAGAHGFAVHMHRAGAALANAAAILRAIKAQMIAQYPEQRRFGINILANLAHLAVDLKL